MNVCRMCDARLGRNATWCGVCLTPVAVDKEEAVSLVQAIDDPPPAPEHRHERWRPPAEIVRKPAAQQFSRLAQTPTTFGWKGRVMCSVLFFVLAWGVFTMSGGGVLGTFAVSALAPLYGMGLRDVWRKGRIR
jgi:hypothetical protein